MNKFFNFFLWWPNRCYEPHFHNNLTCAWSKGEREPPSRSESRGATFRARKSRRPNNLTVFAARIRFRRFVGRARAPRRHALLCAADVSAAAALPALFPLLVSLCLEIEFLNARHLRRLSCCRVVALAREAWTRSEEFLLSKNCGRSISIHRQRRHHQNQ